MKTIEFEHLEAVLFAAAAPLSLETLCDVFDAFPVEMRDALIAYGQSLEGDKRGIRLKESAIGIELVTSPSSSAYVQRIRQKAEKLSPAALETLAIITFKQPITKGEIEALRGVNCEKVLKQLMGRDLIQEVGRKETIGRPVIFGTTDQFLQVAGVTNLEELKELLESQVETPLE